jgi:hypothetical protein
MEHVELRLRWEKVLGPCYSKHRHGPATWDIAGSLLKCAVSGTALFHFETLLR